MYILGCHISCVAAGSSLSGRACEGLWTMLAAELCDQSHVAHHQPLVFQQRFSSFQKKYVQWRKENWDSGQ